MMTKLTVGADFNRSRNGDLLVFLGNTVAIDVAQGI